MKVALVHDWLTKHAGAEKVLQELCVLFPEAPIYTLICNHKAIKDTPFVRHKIYTSFIQKLPLASKKFRWYLSLFPFAIEQFDLSSYDLIISSSHCVAKGVLTSAEQCHICYCHTPPRYAWDMLHEYKAKNKIKQFLEGRILHRFRIWDQLSSNRVDHFIANSSFVANRIEKIYGKKAHVIYPPVDTNYFSLNQNKESFYLTASRLVPYKKISLIVDAFADMPDKQLIVIGDGPEMKNLKKRENIKLLGYQVDEVLQKMMQKAKGFVFAAKEDFGITPVEAMSSGTPVIAYDKGGAAETVLPYKSGLFFHEQTVDAIQEAVEEFEKITWDPAVVRDSALCFSKERFRTEIEKFIEKNINENRSTSRWQRG